jgi:hypothetical protein
VSASIGVSAQRGHRHAGGQETLQTILVVFFVLVPVVVAILSVASLVHVYIAAQAAAASGARAAGAAGEFGSAELARVQDELRGNGVDPAGCVVTPSSATVGLDQPISVTVVCPQHVGIPFLLTTDLNLSSTFVARGEVDR